MSKASPAHHLFVATRKGLWILSAEGSRDDWRLAGPHFLGSNIHHAVLDPRDGRTLLVAARTGHLGPTVFRSTDGGKAWKEAKAPPAFAPAQEGERKRKVNHTFWLTPGHASEPGVWYAGTSPQGLFRSEDGGITWAPIPGLNDHPDLDLWSGGEKDGTPDGPKLHSVIVDPRDPAHLYIGMSSGGIFESWDRGETWSPLNKGVAMDFYPGETRDFGHDPHCVAVHPLNPDRLYHQNHCGIYRLDRPAKPSPEDRWVRIGDNMPRDVGDIGFPVSLHPRDPDTLWVYPMDGTDVWPRTSPGGRPAVFRSRDAGESWERLNKGLPESQVWWSVKRQCMTVDAEDAVGVYFGTSSGAVYGSTDEGDSWRPLAAHLPHVYAVTYARADVDFSGAGAQA